MQTNLLSPVLMVLMIVLVLLSIVAIFYLYITAKSRERLALIEKGMDPNLSRSYFWPQVGIIGAGFCLGLVADDRLSLHFGPLMGFIFAGAGLVIFYFTRRPTMYKGR